MHKIISLPDGSYSKNFDSTYGMKTWEDELNSLPNGESTVEMQYDNLAGTEFSDVKIYLGPINCTDDSSKVSIISGDEAYENFISPGHSGKIIFFMNIPSTFLQKFVVKNESGVDFFNVDNLICVMPRYS